MLVRHLAGMGVQTNTSEVFVRMRDRKNQLGGLKRRWKYYTERYFKKMG
jgi:hypothetical protein